MFELNPSLDMSVEPFGNNQFCVVIDDFLARPEAVIDWARSRQADFAMPERSYPGKVLDVDAGRLAALHGFVRRQMSRQFGFSRAGLTCQTLLSLTTLQPAEFNWLQRLPHTDPEAGPGRANYAGLVYLFRRPELGGTGFYRLKDAAFMQRIQQRHARDPESAMRLLCLRYPEFLAPPAYVTRSTECVELLHRVPARFNRLVFYSGDIPHSAYISDPGLLRDDVGEGRLTLNLFASVRPLQAN